MKRFYLFFGLLIFYVQISKAQDSINENITCEEALELIKNHSSDSNFIILDLRTGIMYKEGHIKNALFHDVFSADIDDYLNSLNKEKVYLLYCNVGRRSGIALDKMKEMGFKNIYHMNEGMVTWKEKGLEIIVE